MKQSGKNLATSGLKGRVGAGRVGSWGLSRGVPLDSVSADGFIRAALASPAGCCESCQDPFDGFCSFIFAC